MEPPITELRQPPTIGRHDLIDLIARALTDERGHGILLRSAAGAGRTHLLDHAVARVAPRPVLELRGELADAPRPFTSLERALPGLLGAETGAERAAASILATAIARIRAEGWAALAVDDADLLDGASAQVVQHLLLDAHLPAVLTARTGAALPEPIVALRVQGAIDVVAVDPLTDQEVGTFVEALLGAPIDLATQRRLAMLSEGLPHHILELTRAATARGAMQSDGGVVRWRRRAGHAWELGGLVRARVDARPDAERRVLALLAVGGDVPLPLLAALGGDDAVRGVRSTDLTVERAGVASLAHPVIVEVVRDAHDADQLDRLRVELALALEAAGGPDARLRSLALRTEAGQPPPAALVLDAASEVLRRGDAALAAELYEQAAPLHPGPALLGLARAREALDEPEGALAAIAALLRQPVPPAVQLEAATLAGRIALESAPADAARGRDLIDRTSALDAPTAMRHEAEVVAAAHLLGSGETAEGLLVVADHVAGGSPEAVLLAAEAHAARGAPVAARALLEEVVPGSGAPAALRVLELVGDVTALARLGDELRGRAVATPGDDELRLQADLASGLAALGAGMARQAVTLLRPCATSPGCGRAGLVLAGPRLVEALAIARERDAAARVLSRLAAADRSAVEQIDLDRAQLVVQLASTPHQLRPASVLELLDRTAASGRAASALELAVLAWRAAPDPSLCRWAIECAAAVDGDRATAIGVLLEASEQHDPDAALRAADLLGKLGRSAEAAEATDLAASLLAAAGANRRAVASALDARRMARELDAPLLRATAPIPLPRLTDREVEIARLVRDGHANREIAELLFLSVRTVEGHVLRASAKVGVDDRVGLGRAIDLVEPTVGTDP